MLIDTHAHYDDEVYDNDRDAIISELKDRNIVAVNVGASFESALEAVKISETYDNIFAAVGMHPDEVAELNDEHMQKLIELSAKPKVVAIGEIGLDYHSEEVPHDVQKKWFIRQIDVARECRLPICVHSRDAAQDTFDIIKNEDAAKIGGVVHCYSYGVELAKLYNEMGFFFGIGGVVTFKNAKKLKEVVDYLPLEKIVLETDCPYLAPTPHRGERNYSGYLDLVAGEIAEIKNVDIDRVIEVTTENAKRLYPKLSI